MRALRRLGRWFVTHKHGEEEALVAVDVAWLATRMGLAVGLGASIASAAVLATSSSAPKPPVLQLSLQGAAFVERHEGVRHYPYQDPSGIAACTVGAGHVLAWRYCTPAQLRTYYSDAQIAALLIRDSSIAAACINRLGVRLDQAQFDALVDLTFNAGCGSLDYRGVRYELQHGQLSSVPASIRVTATTAGGRYLVGLATRRADEAMLFAHHFYGPGIGYLAPRPRKICKSRLVRGTEWPHRPRAAYLAKHWVCA